MESVFPNGYLELAIGPMFSGKTSWILEMYEQHIFCGKKVMVINHSDDKRYDNEMLSTHDKKMIPCSQMSNFDDIDSKVLRELFQADVILINEGQFFKELVGVVKMLLSHKKIIYVCGLDGDFEQKKIGELLDLIPICDKVHKLRSMCAICKNGTRAIFSFRNDESSEQKLIGSDMYLPVCRKCYQDNSTKKKERSGSL